MTKNKNRSKTIKPGRTLQTRDEYFEGAKDYRKPGYEHKGNYRKAVVVDTNRRNEMAVVKLHKPGQAKPISGSRSTYKPFVETKDDEGKPIRAGKKFVLNRNDRTKNISKKGVAEIKKDTFNDSYIAIKNRNKVREMKGRKWLKKSTGKNPYKPKT